MHTYVHCICVRDWLGWPNGYSQPRHGTEGFRTVPMPRRGPHDPRTPALAHLGLPVGLIVTQHLCGTKEIGPIALVQGAAKLLFVHLDLVNNLCEVKITSFLLYLSCL